MNTVMKKQTLNEYLKGVKGKMVELNSDVKSKLISESGAGTDYDVYHGSYGSAIDAIEKYANSRGYELDQDEYTNAFIDGFFKPSNGETKKDSLELYKNGKLDKKQLHSQIYNTGNSFELNMYIW